MKSAVILPKLVALNALLDESLIEFYTPNQRAVREVAKVASPRMSRPQWKEAFGKLRRLHPKPPEKVEGVVVKASNGKLYSSELPFHPIAAEELRKERPKDYDYLARVPDRAERAKGFKTNQQAYVTRGEATQIARRKGWRAPDQKWRKDAAPGLHGGDLRDLP